MSPTPETDRLDDKLSGDWDRCYAQMHSHAMKLEVRLRDKVSEVAELKEELNAATAAPAAETISRAQLRRMTMDQIVAWLGTPPPETDLRKITVPED